MDIQNTYTGFLILWYPPPHPHPTHPTQKNKKKQNKGGRLSGSTVLSY